MNSILDFLKKIFKIGVLANIIATTTLFITILFGYSQYEKNIAQKVQPSTFGRVEKDKAHSTVIIYTNDTVKFLYPALCPSFKNTSKYSIKDLFVETTVIFPISPDDRSLLFPNDEFKNFNVRLVRNTTQTTYNYKSEALFPFETTPTLVKEFHLYPQDENKLNYYQFQINSKLMWDGKEPQEFESFVTYKAIPDDYKMDRQLDLKDSVDAAHFKEWLGKVANELKGKMGHKGIDLVLAYHSNIDTINFTPVQRGALMYLHDMTESSISNLTNMDRDFLEKHDYAFDKPQVKLSYKTIELVMGIISILLLILTISFFIKEHATFSLLEKFLWFDFFFMLLAVIYASLSHWLVCIEYVSFSFYNESWKITLFGMILSIILCIYFIIKMLGIFIKIYSDKGLRSISWSRNKDQLFILFLGFLFFAAYAFALYDFTKNISSYQIPIY